MTDLSKFYNIAGLDVKAGLESVSHMEDIFIDILETFVQEFSGNILNIKTAFDAENLNDLAIYIHSMKSSLNYLGATDLADTAFNLELAAKNGNVRLLNSDVPLFIDKVTDFNDNLKAAFDS